MALEIGEHLLSVHKEHCVGRNQLDIYGKVGFSAQHANKSLASEEPAFVKMYCGRSFFFAVLCLMFSAGFCVFFFFFFLFRAIVELGRSQIRIIPVVRDTVPRWNPAAFMGFPSESWFPMEISSLVVIVPLGNFQLLINNPSLHVPRPALRPLHIRARPFSKALWA